MTIKEAQQLIDEIEFIDLQTESGIEIFNDIIENRVIKGYVFKLTLNPHKGLFYVRARILKNPDDYFRTIDDHSYNKKKTEYIKRGRANFEKQATFYVARDRITSFAEVFFIQNKQEEEKVAYGISRWVINKPMNFTAILNPDTMHKLDCDELKDFQEFLSQRYQNLRGTDKEGTIIIYKYLSEKFTEIIVKGEEHK